MCVGSPGLRGHQCDREVSARARVVPETRALSVVVLRCFPVSPPSPSVKGWKDASFLRPSLEEETATHSMFLLGNPMDRGAW